MVPIQEDATPLFPTTDPPAALTSPLSSSSPFTATDAAAAAAAAAAARGGAGVADRVTASDESEALQSILIAPSVRAGRGG